jgi:hypothetical protein
MRTCGGRHSHNTFGRSGQIRLQRPCSAYASRFGQSPLSCSFHSIMLPRRPYVAIKRATLYRPLRWQRVHSDAQAHARFRFPETRGTAEHDAFARRDVACRVRYGCR